MGLKVDDVVRNASELIRRTEEPMNGAYALFGLTTLRLEDEHLDVDSWPQKARWEKLEERIDELEQGDKKGVFDAPIDSVQEALSEAVEALRAKQDTEDIGRALDELGLSNLRSLVSYRSPKSEGKGYSRGDFQSKAELEKQLVDDYINFVRQLNISDLEPKQIARLSDEFLAVASEMSSTAEFFTPPSIASLVAKLLEPRLAEAERIYDPTAGSGGLLLTIHREAVSKGSSGPSIHGQEIRPQIAAVARINARLHGVTADIETGDTLTNPQHLQEDGSVNRFDVVVANPPIGLRARGERLEKIRSTYPDRFQFGPVTGRGLETAFFQHAVSSLSKKGYAAILAPPRLLKTHGQEQKVIKSLLKDDLIEAVIRLPNGVLANTGIQPSLFLINCSKPEEKKSRVLLVDASEEGDDRSRPIQLNKSSLQKIPSIVANGADVPRFSISVALEKILENDGDLNPSRYILDRDITGFLKGYVDWKPFRRVASISKGMHVETDEDGEIPALTPADLADQLPSKKNQIGQGVSREDGERLPKVQEGDLVLATAGSLRIQEITRSLTGAVCSDHIHRIRLKENYEDFKAFLVDFLSSGVGIELVQSRSVGLASRVPTQELESLPVPIPGPDVAGLADVVKEVEQELSSQMKKVTSLRRELFGFDKEEEAGTIIRKLAADAKILSSSLGRTDDLDYRVRNFYPFPLAYVYRGLQSIGDPAQQHAEILRIVEHVVSFLASIGISIGKYEDLIPDQDNANLSKDALEDAWKGGIALGTWKTLAQSTARVLRDQSKTNLASDYAAIWFSGSGQSKFDACVDEIVQIRNDASHGRGPTTRMEYLEEVQRLSDKLEMIYEEIGFLVNYPLHYVRNLDLHWGEENFRVEHLKYTGDHPGMAVAESHLPYPVTCGLLYIESGNDRWVPLHPIVSVQHCPKCKRRETYALDKWSGKDKYSLKSFERGHAVTTEDAHMQDMGEHVADFFSTG